MKYRVIGTRRLVIDNVDYEPGDEFVAPEDFTNVETLVQAGHIERLALPPKPAKRPRTERT